MLTIFHNVGVKKCKRFDILSCSGVYVGLIQGGAE